MLLSVYEASYCLDVTPRHLYYLLEMYKLDGAIKVFSSWRIDEGSLKELYDRIDAERVELIPDDSRLQRFETKLEAVRQKCLENDCGSPFARIQRRRRNLECSPIGFDCMAGGKAGRQLEFDFDY